MIAYLNLRYMDDERARLFRSGLTALGYQIVHGLCHSPDPDDILITWNRIGAADHAADCFARNGAVVLVAENSSWGNDFANCHWFHIARNYHNTAGMFPVGDASRWDRLHIELAPWRTEGETVVLPQRGIGPVGVAMPRGWASGKSGRVRLHPGQRTDGKTLKEDLANAGKAITWGSGAAVKAIMWGIPVESHMPHWIAEQDNTDEGRLAMFRSLAWAQWRHSEIESGEAFERLLRG